jgi:hypothetical protein
VRCAPGPLSLKGAAREGHQRRTYPLRSGYRTGRAGARGVRSPETVPPPELTLLVAAGEQEDPCPFFASRRHGALA